MAHTLPPRSYVAVDRLSKLIALVAVALGLGHAFGSLSIPLALVGVVVGLATVFVDVEE